MTSKLTLSALNYQICGVTREDVAREINEALGKVWFGSLYGQQAVNAGKGGCGKASVPCVSFKIDFVGKIKKK